MILKQLLAVGLMAPAALGQVVAPEDFSAEDIDTGDALAQLQGLASKLTEGALSTKRAGCSPDNVKIRREW